MISACPSAPQPPSSVQEKPSHFWWPLTDPLVGRSSTTPNSTVGTCHRNFPSFELPSKQKEFNLELEHFGASGSVLYAFGGHDKQFDSSGKAWRRNIDRPLSSWTPIEPMSQPRKLFASVLFGGSLYALGGIQKSGSYHYLNSCERYNSQANVWCSLPGLKLARWGAAAAASVTGDGCLYIAGGSSQGGVVCERTVERYDPREDAWRLVAPMTTARCFFTLTPFAGRLWAVGGQTVHRPEAMASVESYDPATDRWQEEAPLAEPRRKTCRS